MFNPGVNQDQTLPDVRGRTLADLTCSVSVHTHRVPVHVAPDSSCNLTGEQDDEAGEELRDGPETQQVSASILLPELRLRETCR